MSWETDYATTLPALDADTIRKAGKPLSRWKESGHETPCQAEPERWDYDEWPKSETGSAYVESTIELCKTQCPALKACRLWLDDQIEEHGHTHVHGIIAGTIQADRIAEACGDDEIQHGTISGWSQHIYRKVPLCLPCREAKREYDRAGRPPKCGTMRGYRAHLSAKEVPCPACTEAMREDGRKKYARKKAREKANA